MERKQIKISLQKALLICLMVLIIIFVLEVVLVPKSLKDEVLPEVQNEVEEQDKNTTTNPHTTGNNSTSQNLNSDFCTAFLKMENNKKNIVYSPLSIEYALKMLEEGADGNTKKQINNVIGNLNPTKYNSIDKVLSLANAVYIRNTYAEYVKKEYVNTVKQKYDAEVIYDEFKDATNVNLWIENKTLGIIKNMLDNRIVQNPDTKMLLINALAIDMEWKNAFDTDKTYGADFQMENGQKMKATTMHKETSSDSFSYYKDDNLVALSMDLKQYDDNQLEFIAIMPNDDLSKYIETFDIDKLNSITAKMTNASQTKDGVDISIPKFSFDYELELKKDLINLGITDAFIGGKADFSKMSKEELHVDDALHKADIEFTEKGVKAAAVTVFIMKANSMLIEEKKPVEVKIDKPFLFVIKDKETGEIWFVGSVYEPHLWENDKEEYKPY